MKKISEIEMSKIEGGIKCIYHYMAAVVILSNPISGAIDYFWGGNGTAARECWNNRHSE
jgi:hypothetical protein